MEIAAIDRPKPRGKGRPFLPGVSGNPKGKRDVRQRAEELFVAMAPDFGELSATDTILLRQACLLLARSAVVHRVRDIDAGVRLSSEARRILQALRRGRDHKRESEQQPELATYLQKKYGAASNGAPLVAQNSEQAAEEPSDETRTSEPANGFDAASSDEVDE